MTPANILRLSALSASLMLLAGCAGTPATPAAAVAAQAGALTGVSVSGVVGLGKSAATITVYDAKGQKRIAKSDASGRYTFAADGLVAPLMLVADAGKAQYVTLLAAPQGKTSANLNALTDWVSSNVATAAKFDGPVDLVATGKAPAVSAADMNRENAALLPLIGGALQEAGIKSEGFDPATADAAKLAEVLGVMRHNRGYVSAKGTIGDTSIYDYNYRELSAGAPLKLAAARAEREALNAPGTVRVFVAGDSTASNYDVKVAPRMGWGQAFDRQFKAGSPVRVVNVAQSGRSSRSFINEGWFDMIAGEIRRGDYLLVQFGHNDEKCGSEPVRPNTRDAVDIAGLCTYPGDAAGMPADMSFRKTLEKYIAIAKNAGATPVLITPVTRRSFKNGTIGETTHTYGKGKFPGDYSQTIRDTAKANNVALVDLDAKSMAFFSKAGETGSLQYYLAVDPAKYPYYLTNTGSITKPDNTHFQEKGAEAVGSLVAEGLREAKLPLAAQLK